MQAIKSLFVIIFFMSFTGLSAQVSVGEKVKDQSDSRANNKVDQGIDQGLESVGNGWHGQNTTCC